MDLVYIWYDYRLYSELVLLYDLEFKVMDFEIIC